MYHIYVAKVNDNYKWYGFFNTQKEADNLVKYWNFLYPDRKIGNVK